MNICETFMIKHTMHTESRQGNSCMAARCNSAWLGVTRESDTLTAAFILQLHLQQKCQDWLRPWQPQNWDISVIVWRKHHYTKRYHNTSTHRFTSNNIEFGIRSTNNQLKTNLDTNTDHCKYWQAIVEVEIGCYLKQKHPVGLNCVFSQYLIPIQ